MQENLNETRLFLDFIIFIMSFVKKQYADVCKKEDALYRRLERNGRPTGHLKALSHTISNDAVSRQATPGPATYSPILKQSHSCFSTRQDWTRTVVDRRRPKVLQHHKPTVQTAKLRNTSLKRSPFSPIKRSPISPIKRPTTTSTPHKNNTSNNLKTEQSLPIDALSLKAQKSNISTGPQFSFSRATRIDLTKKNLKEIQNIGPGHYSPAIDISNCAEPSYVTVPFGSAAQSSIYRPISASVSRVNDWYRWKHNRNVNTLQKKRQILISSVSLPQLPKKNDQTEETKEEEKDELEQDSDESDEDDDFHEEHSPGKLDPFEWMRNRPEGNRRISEIRRELRAINPCLVKPQY